MSILYQSSSYRELRLSRTISLGPLEVRVTGSSLYVLFLRTRYLNSSILNFIFLKVLKENKARVTFMFMMASFYTILYVYTFLIFKWDNFVFLDRVRVRVRVLFSCGCLFLSCLKRVLCNESFVSFIYFLRTEIQNDIPSMF